MFTTLILYLSLLFGGVTASSDDGFGGPLPPDCEMINGVIVCND